MRLAHTIPFTPVSLLGGLHDTVCSRKWTDLLFYFIVEYSTALFLKLIGQIFFHVKKMSS